MASALAPLTTGFAQEGRTVDCAASARERLSPEVYHAAYLEARQEEIVARRAVETSVLAFDDLAMRRLRSAGGLLTERAEVLERERRIEASASARTALCRAALLERLAAIDRSRQAPVTSFVGRWRITFVGPSSAVVGGVEMAPGGGPNDLLATFSLRPEVAAEAPLGEALAAGEPVLLVWDEGRIQARGEVRDFRFEGGLDLATGMLRGEFAGPAATNFAGTWTAESLGTSRQSDGIEEENIEPP